jgi:uncharacterized protein involved in exopolysaccharide biosynthesis
MGISIGSSASSQSPRFYAEVVQSRELLENALRGKYPLTRPGGAGPDSAVLLDFLRARGRTPARRLEAGVRSLRSRIDASVNNQTGTVQLSVDAKDPVLAAAVANGLVRDLNAFNLDRRQSSARARRQFIEQRLVGAAADLRTAESNLADWLRANRSFQMSPQLEAEYQRLQRQVTIRQETYLTLSRQYETAKIEEVNSTPLITVIDSAVPPQTKSKPSRRLWLAAGLLVGLLAGVLTTFWREYLDRARRESPEDFEELDRALATARWKRLAERPQRAEGE